MDSAAGLNSMMRPASSMLMMASRLDSTIER